MSYLSHLFIYLSFSLCSFIFRTRRWKDGYDRPELMNSQSIIGPQSQAVEASPSEPGRWSQAVKDEWQQQENGRIGCANAYVNQQRSEIGS